MNSFLHLNDQFTKQLAGKRYYALNANVRQQKSSFAQAESTITSESGTKKHFQLKTKSSLKSYPDKCTKTKRVNAFKGFLSTVAAR